MNFRYQTSLYLMLSIFSAFLYVLITNTGQYYSLIFERGELRLIPSLMFTSLGVLIIPFVITLVIYSKKPVTIIYRNFFYISLLLLILSYLGSQYSTV